MKYTFPIIKHIDDVRGLLGPHRPEFFMKDGGDYYVFNYMVNMPTTFPDVTDWETAVLREFRGLTFDKLTGRVVGRKYHKFFNLDERRETEARKVDLSLPHRKMEKLDGSMITPFIPGSLDDIDYDNLRWHTKMGDTDVAAHVYNFVNNGNEHYARYAAHIMCNNCTPIFEFCSRKQRIVLDYPRDRLVLTAVRNNETGEYLPYDELVKAERSNIEVAKVWDFDTDDVQAFKDHVRGIEDAEGFVVRFDSGHMLKIKGEWYCTLHKAVSSISEEKDVWRMVLTDNADDIKAFISEDDRDRLDKFEATVLGCINTLSQTMTEFLEKAKVALDLNTASTSQFFENDQVVKATKRAFAIDWVKGDPGKDIDTRLHGLLFTAFDTKLDAEGVRKLLVDWAVGNTKTRTKVDGIRSLFANINWNDRNLEG